jgi:hypothetical protein
MKGIVLKALLSLGFLYMISGCKDDLENEPIEIKWNQTGTFIPSNKWRFYTDTLQDSVGNSYGQISRFYSGFIQLNSTQYDGCASAQAFFPLPEEESETNLQPAKRIDFALRKCVRSNNSEAFLILIRDGRYIQITLGNWQPNQQVRVEIMNSSISAVNLTTGESLAIANLSSFNTQFVEEGLLFFAKGCGAQQNNQAIIEVSKIQIFTPSLN